MNSIKWKFLNELLFLRCENWFFEEEKEREHKIDEFPTS